MHEHDPHYEIEIIQVRIPEIDRRLSAIEFYLKILLLWAGMVLGILVIKVIR